MKKSSIPTEIICMEVPTCKVTVSGSGKRKVVRIITEQGKEYVFKVEVLCGYVDWRDEGVGIVLGSHASTIWIRTEHAEKIKCILGGII